MYENIGSVCMIYDKQLFVSHNDSLDILAKSNMTSLITHDAAVNKCYNFKILRKVWAGPASENVLKYYVATRCVQLSSAGFNEM